MTTSNNEHTPGPWVYREAIILGSTLRQWVVENADRKKTICGQVLNEANARFIVKSVNCHEELLEALKELLNDHDNTGLKDITLHREFVNKAKQAIAKAEG